MKKKIAALFRIILRMLLFLLFLFVLVILAEYVLCPVYKMKDPQPFRGDKLYNPYEGTDSLHWKKANFQTQSRVYEGMTNGRANTNEMIRSIYRNLRYDIIGISDYQQINRFYRDSSFYVPIYEHGYGLKKNHQVCIGSSKVLWTDYPIFQTLRFKQHILDLLRRDNAIVAIAHPDMKGAYSTDDMKYLSDYDLIEALNHLSSSIPHWDAALSAGKPVFILGDDDNHDVRNPTFSGRMCTYICSASGTKEEIYSSLRNGQSYGANIRMYQDETYPEKFADALHVPCLTALILKGDTICCRVSEKAMSIDFIGENGKLKKRISDKASADYIFGKEDTYIRTEITFRDKYQAEGTKFFLNPVFRYSGDQPVLRPAIPVDLLMTWIYRVLGIAVLFILIIIQLRFFAR